MKPTATHQPETTNLPILSSQNQGWENILVEQFQHSPGEGNCHYSDEHAICLSLAPRPVRLLQVKGGKTYAGLHGKGDISITPAEMPVFARWDSDDHYLQIRITSRFIQSVARETIDLNPDQLELLPEFRTRDRQLEAIGMMLLSELKQENLGGRLYIESLANVLAVHLLRQYSAVESRLSFSATSRTGKAVVETNRPLDYRHCLPVWVQQPQPFEQTVSAIYRHDTESLQSELKIVRS